MSSYRVAARRTGDWWALAVPELPGAFSQAKRLDQADEAAREAISLMLDVAPESVEVEVVPELPDETRALLRQVEAAKAESARAANAERAAMREAAAALSAELSLRDTGRLLGVSFQRVSQLLKEHRPLGKSAKATRKAAGAPAHRAKHKDARQKRQRTAA